MNLALMRYEILKLIREYAPEGTEFEWDNAVRRFGRCSYKFRKEGSNVRYYNFKISISYPLASQNSWEEVKKTVLHEIAHARTPGHGHDYVWQRECLAIGGDGKRCYSSTNTGGGVITLPYKWIGTCPVCGKTFPRNRRVLRGYHCSSSQKLVWTENKEV